MYGANPTTTKSLSSNIQLSVVQGNGASFSSCDGFTPLATGSSVYDGTLANFGATATNYSTGFGDWTTAGAGDETRTFQFTYTVDANTPDTAQGGTAAIGFTWEAQNT